MSTLPTFAKSKVRAGAGLSAPLRGALWMCAAATCFALMITLVRQLTDDLHPLQVVFFRTAFGLAGDVALAAAAGRRGAPHRPFPAASAARADRHLRDGRVVHHAVPDAARRGDRAQLHRPDLHERARGADPRRGHAPAPLDRHHDRLFGRAADRAPGLRGDRSGGVARDRHRRDLGHLHGADQGHGADRERRRDHHLHGRS